MALMYFQAGQVGQVGQAALELPESQAVLEILEGRADPGVQEGLDVPALLLEGLWVLATLGALAVPLHLDCLPCQVAQEAPLLLEAHLHPSLPECQRCLPVQGHRAHPSHLQVPRFQVALVDPLGRLQREGKCHIHSFHGKKSNKSRSLCVFCDLFSANRL